MSASAGESSATVSDPVSLGRSALSKWVTGEVASDKKKREQITSNPFRVTDSRREWRVTKDNGGGYHVWAPLSSIRPNLFPEMHTLTRVILVARWARIRMNADK